MRTLIKNGLLIDPANRVCSKLNLLTDGGRVCAVTIDEPAADKVIDAAGKIVSPGFVDIHMHEDPVEADGKLYTDAEKSIFHCMLRMGVTTVLAGQCGQNRYHPADYLDIVDRDGAAVNVGMLAGHAWFRNHVGATDKYAPTTPAQNRQMAEEIAHALGRGVMGLSYGIRYVPGLNTDEMLASAAPCRKGGKLIAAHLRSDAEEVFDAARELLDIGLMIGLPIQVSHIGSMAGFGQMERFLQTVDAYRMKGLDVSCDCYPYYAFSTHIGSTTYDDGWMERYNCGYDAVELCEGKYKGQRCNKEMFEEMRRDNPDCITVCRVMKSDDVDMAFRHPNVMLASDGIMNYGQGHPRAAGTFPRLIAEFVRTGKLSLCDAVNRMTAMPADRLGLARKGRLNVGADADVTVFDPNLIRDNATFSQPLLAPSGVDCVLIGGEVAAENGRIIRRHLGKSIRK